MDKKAITIIRIVLLGRPREGCKSFSQGATAAVKAMHVTMAPWGVFKTEEEED
jgi:hypothetical protein